MYTYALCYFWSTRKKGEKGISCMPCCRMHAGWECPLSFTWKILVEHSCLISVALLLVIDYRFFNSIPLFVSHWPCNKSWHLVNLFSAVFLTNSCKLIQLSWYVSIMPVYFLWETSLFRLCVHICFPGVLSFFCVWVDNCWCAYCFVNHSNQYAVLANHFVVDSRSLKIKYAFRCVHRNWANFFCAGDMA